MLSNRPADAVPSNAPRARARQASKKSRERIDWAPGLAASQAVEIAAALFPQLSRQALIDRLVITGLYALKQPPWQPPQLWGRDREAWALPSVLRPQPDHGD